MTYEAFTNVLGPSMPTLIEFLKDCASLCTTDVSVNTLLRWWYEYSDWSELPYKVDKRERVIKRINKNTRKNELLDNGDVLILKGIVDQNPNFYLDELAYFFGMTTGKFVHYSTIWRCLVQKLDYSMKVLQVIDKQ